MIKFLQQLEEVLGRLRELFVVVVVNDCSTDDTRRQLEAFRFTAGNIRLQLLHLRFNVGHQGAIFQGMLYARELACEHFIIMDSDGEDSPLAIPELLTRKGADIVHVVRGKRQEGLLFRTSYFFYKLIFRFVTGKQMNFGNYCLISRKVLETAVFHSFSHFAAFLSRQKGVHQEIIVGREKRLDGSSKMNFRSLLYHAFRSFVEYGEDMLLLFVKCFVLIMLLFLAVAANLVYQKFFANTAILGWTSVVAIGLLNMAILSIGFFVIGILLLNVSNQKNPNNKIPIYDEPDSTSV